MQAKLYLPFLKGWRLAIGLQSLNVADWIEIDADFADQLALKQNLLTDRYAEVFTSLPGSEPAQQEVLEQLVAHLLQYFPRHYQQQGHVLENLKTDQRWNLLDFAAQPLDLAGRLVQEDLCLLLPDSEGYRLAAASVCFPSRWSLAEKIGQPLGQIHAPVPGYDRQLRHPVDQLFAKLKPDYPGYRFNWGIVDSPQLFLPPAVSSSEESPPITAENAGHRLWVRVERQTLRRFSIHNSVLFTIRTYVYPIHTLVTDRSTTSSLLAAIQQIPEAMQRYKNLLCIRPALLQYLTLYTQSNAGPEAGADWAGLKD